MYGNHTFTVNMTDVRKIGVTEGWIQISAYVTDNATALTMASEKLVKILPTQSVYVITDVLNKMAFVPGLNYSTVVCKNHSLFEVV